jgi:hypothetical protein
MRKSLFMAVGGLVGLVVVVVGSSPGVAAPPCHQVHYPAHVHSSVYTGPNCTATAGACTSGFFTGDHLLNGTTFAVGDGVAESAGMPGAEPASTLSFDTIYTITTDQGSVSFNDTGVFDGAAGLFAERMVVISGTGVFSRASGHLFFTGTGTTSFSADVTGEICLHAS